MAKAKAELVAAPTFLLRTATTEASNSYPQAGGMTERSDGGPPAAALVVWSSAFGVRRLVCKRRNKVLPKETADEFIFS
jgi:hypothetical protein